MSNHVPLTFEAVGAESRGGCGSPNGSAAWAAQPRWLAPRRPRWRWRVARRARLASPGDGRLPGAGVACLDGHLGLAAAAVADGGNGRLGRGVGRHEMFTSALCCRRGRRQPAPLLCAAWANNCTSPGPLAACRRPLPACGAICRCRGPMAPAAAAGLSMLAFLLPPRPLPAWEPLVDDQALRGARRRRRAGPARLPETAKGLSAGEEKQLRRRQAVHRGDGRAAEGPRQDDAARVLGELERGRISRPKSLPSRCKAARTTGPRPR